MNRKKGIIIATTGIFIVALALIGFTYGFYMSLVSGNESSKRVKVTAGKSKLEYIELSEEVDTIIGPGFTNTKYFAVKNIGDISASYYIYLTEVENTFTRKNDIVYTIYRKLYDYSEENSEPELFDINGVYDFSSWENVTNTKCSTVSEYPTYGDCQYPSDKAQLTTQKQTIIEKNDYYVYAFQVTYINQPDIDQIIDEESVFSGIVKIYADETGTDVSPFEPGTLADAIYMNALNKTNGTELTREPLSGVVTSISGKQFNTTVTETANQTMTPSSTYGTRYWTYADGYTVDEKSGITLTGVKTCKYSECYSTLAGKYLVSNSASSNSNTTDVPKTFKGLTTIYRVDTVGTSATGEVTLTKISIPTTKIDVEESILTSALDDYGTSYYFRGNVENNYVNFAGMCWRIVRIAGDGSTKLILEDAYTTCDDTVDNDGTGTTDYAYTGNWNIGSGVYGYDLDEYDNYKLNYQNPENTGMSLAFKNYQTILAKKIDSSIGETPTLEQVNNTLASKLKVGDWCLDDSAYSDTMGSAPITDLSFYYSWHTSFYYGAYTRIYGTKEPTLKCNGTIMNDFNDNGESSTPMYVATLTTDEIVYAGADSDYSENYNYYLMNEYSSYSYDEETGEETGDYWWALSPIYFFGYDDTLAFVVHSIGGLNGYNVDFDGSFRPAVSLKSGIEFEADGNGTKTNPYVVE